MGFGRACAPVHCAPRLFGLIATPNGALGAPVPAHRCFLFDPQKYIKSVDLGPPTSSAFFFPQEHRGYEMRSTCPPPPASPIAALLILPAIFWGQNYVQVPPYALIFLVFLFYSFWIFSFSYSLPFLLSFLISSYSSRRCYSSSSFSSPLIF